MEDKKYPIELEVITPLSVGAGNDNEWVKGLDFVQKDGKIYVIDMQKATAAGVEIESLTQLFLKYDDAGICRLLGSKIGELSRYVFDQPAKTDNNIKTFLRTQFYDKPLVAGSSIKGSIRSALFNYLRTCEEKNEEVFGTMKEGTDFMRFIRIGDIEMPTTVLVNTKLFNLRKEGAEWFGGWKQQMNRTTEGYNPVGFNTLYECVAPGKKGLGNISLAANAFSLLERYGKNTPYSDKKRELLNEPISYLFQIINRVTRGYLLKERDFFELYPAGRSDEIVEGINYLLSLIPKDGSSCLLKMAAGVGFHSITGDWRYDDYDDTDYWDDPRDRNYGKKKYKSRKIAEYNDMLELMGFVRLRALSKAEAKDTEQLLAEVHHLSVEQILAPIRQREAEREQHLQEELQRKGMAQKQIAYNALVSAARHALVSELWDEAISKAEEATRLCPDNTEAASLIEEIQRAKTIAEYHKHEAFKQAAAASLPFG